MWQWRKNVQRPETCTCLYQRRERYFARVCVVSYSTRSILGMCVWSVLSATFPHWLEENQNLKIVSVIERQSYVDIMNVFSESWFRSHCFLLIQSKVTRDRQMLIDVDRIVVDHPDWVGGWWWMDGWMDVSWVCCVYEQSKEGCRSIVVYQASVYVSHTTRPPPCIWCASPLDPFVDFSHGK